MDLELLYKLVPIDRPGHDLCYSIDPSKLYDLGWQESEAIDQRLAHTIQWYRDNPEWLNR